MALRIERFPEGAEAAAERFNTRLRATGVTEFELPENRFSKRYPEGDDSAVWQQYFLALDHQPDRETEARGGYILQYQPYAVSGEVAPHAFLKLPLSEGIVDKKYALVGVQVVRDAMHREPNLYSVGMGGMKRPLPNLLAKLGWFVREVPFHFRVLQPSRFFNQARILRTSKLRARACDVLAWSGLGWLGAKIVQMRPPGRLADGGCETSLEPQFGPWADELWERCKSEYLFCGARTSHVLNTLYPADDTRWLRLHVKRGGKTIGWALLLNTSLVRHKQFANMRLGSIADCMAAPEDARAVIGAATRHLEGTRAELIVSNQLHGAWSTALRRTGYMSGPSNYVFAASPSLLKKTGPLKERWSEIHINRGDGDGPINL